MATLNEESGSVIAHCIGCQGGRSTFEWHSGGTAFGAVTRIVEGSHRFGASCHSIDYRLFRCAGCGIGAWGVIAYSAHDKYPGSYNQLLNFYPESKESLDLPKGVPEGIRNEFREAEKCLFNECNRAAASMFRSVLDKTMRENGYNTRENRNLYHQIEAAAQDGVITQSRRTKAHQDVRALGNDVMHDDWHEIDEAAVEVARHYVQRLLEDFYDDRNSVEAILIEKGRLEANDGTDQNES